MHDALFDVSILQLVGEVPETGACAYLWFVVSGGDDLPLALPDHWMYSRSGVFLPSKGQACTQATVDDAFGLPEHRHVVHTALNENYAVEGRLSFPSSEPYHHDGLEFHRPCRTSVDLTVELPGQYPWVPRELHFEVKDLAVEPSCGG